MRINPSEKEPRLSWNRPSLDPQIYRDLGDSLFIFEPAEDEVTEEHKVYRQAVAIIEREHANPEFTIESLSSELGFSTRQLQRILKKQGSPGFRTEVKKFRIKDACQQLKETVKPLEEVAIECGYKQPSHFSQVFTKEVGVTPSQYRKQRLGSS
jgi:AraC-like DNA-binding protein